MEQGTGLKWGLTEEGREFYGHQVMITDEEKTARYIIEDAARRYLRLATVNGVPLTDILNDAAEQCKGGFPVERAAVLRALAGEKQ